MAGASAGSPSIDGTEALLPYRTRPECVHHVWRRGAAQLEPRPAVDDPPAGRLDLPPEAVGLGPVARRSRRGSKPGELADRVGSGVGHAARLTGTAQRARA